MTDKETVLQHLHGLRVTTTASTMAHGSYEINKLITDVVNDTDFGKQFVIDYCENAALIRKIQSEHIERRKKIYKWYIWIPFIGLYFLIKDVFNKREPIEEESFRMAAVLQVPYFAITLLIIFAFS
jgi:hypothetical protein